MPHPKWLMTCLWAGFVLSACVAAPAKLYVAGDYIAEHVFSQGIEGPAVDRAGNLYAVSYERDGTIGIVRRRGEAALFVELPPGSTGNGIRFDLAGDMYVADYTGHNILKVDMANGKVSVFAHSERMNQPNDIAITRSGVLYASDPDWKTSSGQLWRIDADGSVTLLESNMGTTNGIEVSVDEKHLYVNESVQRKLWVYDILENGNLDNKRLLIEFADHGLDGMRCDALGNLYIARYGAGVVAVVSPRGELIREIRLRGRYPTNVAFGGPHGRTVFVTMQKRGAIEFFEVEHPGRAWLLHSAELQVNQP